MKKLSIFLFIYFLFILSCEDKVEKDKIPPIVKILSPESDSIVSKTVTIFCETTDNVGVKKNRIMD